LHSAQMADRLLLRRWHRQTSGSGMAPNLPSLSGHSASEQSCIQPLTGKKITFLSSDDRSNLWQRMALTATLLGIAGVNLLHSGPDFEKRRLQRG